MKLLSALAVSSLIVLPLTPVQSLDLNQKRFERLLAQATEVDFENLPWDAMSCAIDPEPTIPNPLSVGGLVLTDPYCLQMGFCSSPTCIPDPDNADLGNIAVALNPGGTIDFPGTPKFVVVDVQGSGDNPFTLRVTDARGRSYDVSDQAIPYGQVLVPLVSPRGIQTIELVDVGGTGGPLAIAAVHYR